MAIINITMKKEELDSLLEKYYNGISTDSEEMALRAYFSGQSVPEEYGTEKVLFGFFSSEVEIPEPSADFESSIIKGVDGMAHRPEVKNLFLRKYLMPLMGAAAGVLILAGTLFFFYRSAESDDTFSDPQLAYAETMKILREVSVKMNKGLNTLEPVGKMDEVSSKSLNVINKSTVNAGRFMNSITLLQPAFRIVTSENDSK
jgi:hypothetical protein